MTSDQTASSDSGMSVGLLAYELGRDALEKSKEQLAEVVACEKTRREKANQSEIESLKARYACLLDRRKELKETTRSAPVGNFTVLLRRRWRYWTVAAMLVIAGIFFADLTLAPFGLGWEAWLFSIGLGVVAAFWTERTIEKMNSAALIRAMCVVAFLSSIGGLVVMALVRGDILGLYVQSAFAANSATQLQNINSTDFYIHAIPKLQLFMAVLAVAMELASGMAVYEAEKIDLTFFELAERARKDLVEVENEMTAIVGRATHLKNDPSINEAQIYRDFYLGILHAIKKSGLLHLIVIGLGLCLCFSAPARAGGNNQDHQRSAAADVVIAIDATQSVSGKEYDGKTAYEKNVDAACAFISMLPPASIVTVLAITDRSFAQPYILAQGELPRDKGPLQFQDRIAIVRTQIANELRRASRALPPRYPHTDIFGALIVGADILRPSRGKKVLVLLSDMRESIPELDLEPVRTVNVQQTLAFVNREGCMADLQGIDVYVLGVDAFGRTVGYWNSLKDFWAAYFAQSRANLKSYSVLRHMSAASF